MGERIDSMTAPRRARSRTGGITGIDVPGFEYIDMVGVDDACGGDDVRGLRRLRIVYAKGARAQLKDFRYWCQRLNVRCRPCEQCPELTHAEAAALGVRKDRRTMAQEIREVAFEVVGALEALDRLVQGPQDAPGRACLLRWHYALAVSIPRVNVGDMGLNTHGRVPKGWRSKDSYRQRDRCERVRSDVKGDSDQTRPGKPASLEGLTGEQIATLREEERLDLVQQLLARGGLDDDAVVLMQLQRFVFEGGALPPGVIGTRPPVKGARGATEYQLRQAERDANVLDAQTVAPLTPTIDTTCQAEQVSASRGGVRLDQVM